MISSSESVEVGIVPVIPESDDVKYLWIDSSLAGTFEIGGVAGGTGSLVFSGSGTIRAAEAPQLESVPRAKQRR